MTNMKTLKDLVHEAIDKGARSVEEVHQSIAKLPLEMLSNIAPAREPVEKLAAIQQQTIGSVYETIRTVNKAVGELAEGLIGKLHPKEK